MNASIQWPARGFAGDFSRWCKRTVVNLQERTTRWLKRLKLRRYFRERSVHDLLPQIAIPAGAIACGLWLNSVAAGLFGLVLLFLLWRIGTSLERIIGFLRTQPPAALSGAWRATGAETAGQRNIYISAKAMQRLRPWVEDESTLTEESAKAYCSVLLDTLAMLHPRLAGKESVRDSWS